MTKPTGKPRGRPPKPKLPAPPPGRAGRPISLNPADKWAHIRMTEGQHLKYMALGGARWIKGLIDETKDTP